MSFDKQHVMGEPVSSPAAPRFDQAQGLIEQLRWYARHGFMGRASDLVKTATQAATALEASSRQEERLREAGAEIKRLVRLATDRQYMIEALVNMLGTNGLKVWDGWQKKGVTRVHYSWGPGAGEMTGERRAAAMLKWDKAAETAAPVSFDEDFEQIEVRELVSRAALEPPHAKEQG